MSRKHKKVCTILNYIEHFLILASSVTGSISMSAFATAQKMEFSIKGFFSKCDQIGSFPDLVTFTEEILNWKLQFLYSVLLCLVFL